MAPRSHPPADIPAYDQLDPAALLIPVPLVVLARCTPAQLAVWVALRWLGAAVPDQAQAVWSYRQLARLCQIDHRTLDRLLAQLQAQKLIVAVGTGRVRHAQVATAQYAIDVDAVAALSRAEFATILRRWQVRTIPQRVPPEQLSLLADASGASGVQRAGATGTSGVQRGGINWYIWEPRGGINWYIWSPACGGNWCIWSPTR